VPFAPLCGYLVSLMYCRKEAQKAQEVAASENRISHLGEMCIVSSDVSDSLPRYP
jgi:hypothetical protein